MGTTAVAKKHFLLASDFDQTLSFNDSGVVLSELIGASNFQAKVDGLAASNLVHQGGELAYLIRHDPEFRGVRKEHLVEAGRRVRLRKDIPVLMEFLQRGLEDCQFSFFVISAAPKEVVESALDGIVPADHIFGTELEYDPRSGEVRSIRRVPAGYGKVSVLEELEARLGTASRSHDLRRRRQLGRPRDAARQQPRRVHHRRIREQAPGPDREAHRAERQRVQHRAAHAPAHLRLADGGDPQALRDLRPDPPRMGQGATPIASR